MKKTKAKIFVELFYYWCGVLGIDNNGVVIEAIKDNRINSGTHIDNWNTGYNILKYNSRRLGQKCLSILISDMFHEIGHLKNNLPYKTKEDKIYSEYKAENFSVQMLKKYYPQEYKDLITQFIKSQTMNRMKNSKDEIVNMYYEAFIKIKEYKDTIIKGGYEK